MTQRKVAWSAKSRCFSMVVYSRLGPKSGTRDVGQLCVSCMMRRRWWSEQALAILLKGFFHGRWAVELGVSVSWGRVSVWPSCSTPAFENALTRSFRLGCLSLAHACA